MNPQVLSWMPAILAWIGGSIVPAARIDTRTLSARRTMGVARVAGRFAEPRGPICTP